MSFPVIVATGTPTEIGRSYGDQCRDLIGANLADYREKFAYAGLTPDEVIRRGRLFQATTRRITPRIAAMLDGIADGAGVEAGEIYALNARSELMSGAGTAISECTALAVLGGRTATGHTALAQNWDWHPHQQPYTIVLATRDEEGHEVLALTEAGMLAKTGLNSAGVGVTVNLLRTPLDGGTDGVPYHVLLRYVLEQPTMSQALTVTALPRGASINLIVASSESLAVDLELAPGAVGRLGPEHGLIVHANHFVSDIGVTDEVLHMGGSSLYRDLRLRDVLTPAVEQRSVSTADLEAALTDHAGLPLAVCRHLDTTVTDRQLWSLTVGSVIMDLNERRMLVSDGPACMAGYDELSLAKVLG